MADSKLYRLRDGAKHLVPASPGTRALRPLEAGETLELNEAQARNWADKFEPADGTPSQAPDPEDQTLDQDPDPSDVPGAEGEAPEGTEGGQDLDLVGGSVDEDPSPVIPTDYTAKELIGFVREDVDPWNAEQLEALAAAEAAGTSCTSCGRS